MYINVSRETFMYNQKFTTCSVYNSSKKNYVKKLSLVYKYIPTN